MKNRSWTIIILVTAVLLCNSSAYTQGLSGWFTVNKNMAKGYEDGELTSDSDTFNRNLNLSFDKPITELLSYQLNLRTNWQDSDNNGVTSYRRSLDPAVDLFMRHYMYDISAGYRRQEQWTTANLTDEGRKSTDFYYSRFYISPEALPSLSLQFDRQKSYDYLEVQTTDSTNTTYSVSSGYELPSKDVIFLYNLNYSYGEQETPLNLTFKSESENFSGSYEVGYSDDFWKKKARYIMSYRGNYSRNANKQFVATSTGSVLTERTPYINGLYDTCSVFPETVTSCDLNNEVNLIDNNLATGIATINLTTTLDHNIGVWTTNKSVDTIYIYYRNTGVAGSIRWEVYTSSDNQNWSLIADKTVAPALDAETGAYRYEITLTPTTATYFKVVNKDLSPQVAGSDVLVSEIEAYGTETPDDDIVVNVFTSFAQGLVFTADVKPVNKLNFVFNYSLDRTDQNLISLSDSIGGFFSNIFSDSLPEDQDNFTSSITRNYGLISRWLTHRYLTTSLQLQRNESFDNTEVTDTTSNTYNLSFSSEPLPTLDANLSFVINDTYRFDEKDTTNRSVLFSVGSKLYKDVNMINDFTYTESESAVNDSESSSRKLSGSLDALLTRKISGTLDYSFNWNESDGTSSSSKEGRTVISYRPGKFINISAHFRVTDSAGALSTTEGFLLDWLPVRAVRLNANYQHAHDDEGPVTTDSVTNYVIWYITKFADMRFSYNFAQETGDTMTESHGFNTQLNCRF